MSERELLEQEIRDLQCDLNASDYRIAKFVEYVTIGENAPYDIDELHAERQEKRDRINEIKDILANMKEDEHGGT